MTIPCWWIGGARFISLFASLAREEMGKYGCRHDTTLTPHKHFTSGRTQSYCCVLPVLSRVTTDTLALVTLVISRTH